MDKFFEQFLANQERIAAALEKIAAVGNVNVSQTVQDNTASDKAAIAAAAKAVEAKVEAAEKAKIAAAEKAAAEKAAAEKAAAEKAAAEKAAAEAEAAAGSTYTLDEVRAALKEYRAIEGAPAMLEVLKTHGGKEALTEVDPSKFAAIMEAVGAAK